MQSADASKLNDNRINSSGFKTCLEVLDRFQEFDLYTLEVGGSLLQIECAEVHVMTIMTVLLIC